MLHPKAYRRLTSKSRSRKRTKRSSMDISCLGLSRGNRDPRVVLPAKRSTGLRAFHPHP